MIALLLPRTGEHWRRVDLAMILYLLGDYDEAERLQEEACECMMDMTENILEIGIRFRSVWLAVCRREGLFDVAEWLHSHTLQILDRIYGARCEDAASGGHKAYKTQMLEEPWPSLFHRWWCSQFAFQ